MTDTFVQDTKTGKWSITKDPNAVLDYVEDWTAWLDGVSDSISTATVVATGSDPATTIHVDSSVISGKTVVAWISGGVAGETVSLRYRITTAAGRTDDRTVWLKIKER
jgi:hypothetical protein